MTSRSEIGETGSLKDRVKRAGPVSTTEPSAGEVPVSDAWAAAIVTQHSQRASAARA
ncbi:hypothetical protein [Rhizobium phaseoli]|uniref:hypothetical protein n=1 Tax=Rhizobium phaseoli TaxID=396 RepID=UPI001F23D063|nr:hypothetical protein [Rhizobium phaseoli]